MKLNELQKYILKIYAIIIIFFTFFIPTINNDITTFNFTLTNNDTNNNFVWVYLLLLYIGITISTIALLLAYQDIKKYRNEHNKKTELK
jgi:uncharacterized membrane protein YdjX (TVP38/TMEM64 family)